MPLPPDFTLPTTENAITPLQQLEQIRQIGREELKLDPSWMANQEKLIHDIGNNKGEKLAALRGQLRSNLSSYGNYLYYFCLTNTLEPAETMEGSNQQRDLEWLEHRYEEFNQANLGKESALPTVRDFRALMKVVVDQGKLGDFGMKMAKQWFSLPTLWYAQLVSPKNIPGGAVSRQDRRKQVKHRPHAGQAQPPDGDPSSLVKTYYLQAAQYNLALAERLCLAFMSLEDDKPKTTTFQGLQLYHIGLIDGSRDFSPPLADICAEYVSTADLPQGELDASQKDFLARAAAVRASYRVLEKLYPYLTRLIPEEVAAAKEQARRRLKTLPGAVAEEDRERNLAAIDVLTNQMIRLELSIRQSKFEQPQAVMLVGSTDVLTNCARHFNCGYFIKIARGMGGGGFRLPMPHILETGVYYLPETMGPVKKLLRDEIAVLLEGTAKTGTEFTQLRPALSVAELNWILAVLGPNHLDWRFYQAYMDGLGKTYSDSAGWRLRGETIDAQQRRQFIKDIQQSGRGLGAAIHIPLAEKAGETAWGMTALDFKPAGQGTIRCRIHFSQCYFDILIVPPDSGHGYVCRGIDSQAQAYEQMDPGARCFMEKVVFAYLSHILKSKYDVREIVPKMEETGGRRVSINEERVRTLLHGGIHFRALPIGDQPHQEHFDDPDVAQRAREVFGPLEVRDVDNGLSQVQQNLAILDQIAQEKPIAAGKVIGRLKAIIRRGEEPRFWLCEEDGRQTVRLCLVSPNYAWPKPAEFELVKTAVESQKILPKRQIDASDFSSGGILDNSQWAREIFEWQQEQDRLERPGPIIVLPVVEQPEPKVILPVVADTKCFYRTTVVLEGERPKEKKEPLIIHCPGVLNTL